MSVRALKGDQFRFASVQYPTNEASIEVVRREKIVEKESEKEIAAISMSNAANCIINTLYILSMIATVGALWTIAVGIWWIKYYVECNRNQNC